MPGAPVLTSITALYDRRTSNGTHVDVMPQFHFVAPNGNAVLPHRELKETDWAITAQQRAGATISGGWPCGPGRYHVTLGAFLEDARSNRGNAIQYTIHCHEMLY